MPAEYGEPLTPRELEMVDLVAEGLTNREIAARVFLSPNTVKVHLRNIFTKTGVASRTELTVLAVQEGWVVVPGVQAEEAPIDDPPSDVNEQVIVETDPEGIKEIIPEAISVGQPDSVLDVIPAFPSWPHERSWALLLGMLLALFIFLLPQRPYDSASASKEDYVFDPSQAPLDLPVLTEDDKWKELAPLPARRAGLGLGVSDGMLYAVGGMTEDGPVADLSVFDIEAESWHVAPSRPVALANVGIGAVGQTLLVPGGCDASWQPQAITHIYDIEQDTWLEVAPLPIPLCAYALAVFDEDVYVFGGLSSAGVYRAVTYVYNFTEDVWAERHPPVEARAFGAAVALKDRIFYVGGHDGRRERGTCEVYIPEQNRWETCTPMLQPRSGLGVTALGNQLQVIGGGWEVYLGFNERYDPSKDQWSALETPIIGEWRNLGVTAWDGALYVVGGWNGDYMNRMYKNELFRYRTLIPLIFSGQDSE